MNLTELRYIVALDSERHFRRAAEACFVSQPSLSQGIKNLEQELGAPLFERGKEILPTHTGITVIQEARRILKHVENIKHAATVSKDPLNGSFNLGLIYSVAPYLLSALVQQLGMIAPKMSLHIKENFTHELIPQIVDGTIEAAFIAAPFPAELQSVALYEEPFVLAVAQNHPWSQRKSISSKELITENLLLMGKGHCFRDNVLHLCPEQQREDIIHSSNNLVEGGSIETIKCTVAAGYGVAVLPITAKQGHNTNLRYIPLAAPTPSRTIGLVWRHKFQRMKAIKMLIKAAQNTYLEGVTLSASAKEP